MAGGQVTPTTPAGVRTATTPQGNRPVTDCRISITGDMRLRGQRGQSLIRAADLPQLQ